MKNADEGADEVIRVGIGTEIAAVDGSLNQGEKGGVDVSARAFNEAYGAAGNRVHDGKDQGLAGDMVDEEQHPGSKSVEWRHGDGKIMPSCCQLFDFATIDGFNQGVAGREMPVKRA